MFGRADWWVRVWLEGSEDDAGETSGRDGRLMGVGMG